MINDTIKVLIAEDNVEFSRLLTKQLNAQTDMQVVGLAANGNEALAMIHSTNPDVVILDIIMPTLDGIDVLETISQSKPERKPAFIVLTAIGQDIFIKRALDLGADYYIVKPFDINLLLTRIRQVYKWSTPPSFYQNSTTNKPPDKKVDQESRENNIELEVATLVGNLGIPIHRSGCRYAIDAILHSVNNKNCFGSVTKTLYPAIAEKYHTTPKKVERAIRCIIEDVWTHGNQNVITSLFGNTILQRGRPTNSEFIAMLSDKIKFVVDPK